MAWVGGANEASGVTKTLSGVLNGIAGNIDTVATAAGAVAAVGVARYFRNVASLWICNCRINYCSQKRSSSCGSAAAGDADSNRQGACGGLSCATGGRGYRGTERQAAAEAKLAAAALAYPLMFRPRTAAQTTLNTVTSVGSRLLSGALGLVGGVPGLVMLGATAWYTMYQDPEQAAGSARRYPRNDRRNSPENVGNVASWSVVHEEKTRQALEEQNRLINEQEGKISRLKNQIADYRQRWLDESSQSGSGAKSSLKGLQKQQINWQLNSPV